MACLISLLMKILGLFQLSALAAGQDLQLSDLKNAPEKGGRLRYFRRQLPFQ